MIWLNFLQGYLILLVFSTVGCFFYLVWVLCRRR